MIAFSIFSATVLLYLIGELVYGALRIRKLRSIYLFQTSGEYWWREAGLNSPRRVDQHTVPGYVSLAILLREDTKFFHHHGINFQAIFNRLKQTLTTGTHLRGGSSVTQQIAKNLFVGDKRSIVRKWREMLYALLIEAMYSKDEIFCQYLSTLRFAWGAYGLEAGAQFYFGVSASQLTFVEALVLAKAITYPVTTSGKIVHRGKTEWYNFASSFDQVMHILVFLHRRGLKLVEVLEFPYQKIQECLLLPMRSTAPLDPSVQNKLAAEAAAITYRIYDRIKATLRHPDLDTHFAETVVPVDRLLVLSIQNALGTKKVTFPFVRQDEIDEGYVSQFAARHSLVPLIYKGLPKGRIGDMLRARLKPDYERNCIHMLRQRALLAPVLDACEKREIDVLFLKGLHFAQTAYSDPSLRMVGDIDLLIHSCDAEKMCTLLTELGYCSGKGSPLGILNRDGVVVFVGSEGLMIDLHIRAIEDRFSTPMDWLWDEAEMREELGGRYYVPSPRHALLLAIMHGAKHLWGRLSWLIDTALLAQKLTTSDWQYCLEKISILECRTRFFTGIIAAQYVSEMRFEPISALSEVERWRYEFKALSILRDIFWKGTSRSRLESTAQTLRILDTPAQRVRLVIDRLANAHL